MDRNIVDYYDRHAAAYDRERFGNNYGKFIDAQERRILGRWLSPEHQVLEIACGTGRLSAMAQVACDASQESLKLARQRRPSTCFAAADATALPFKSQSFDAVFAFHLLMHLDTDTIRKLVGEAARVLRDDGIFVADVASLSRRRVTHRSAQSAWHGNTALSVAQIKGLCAEFDLEQREMTGILFLPIHRLPDRLRPFLLTIDRLLATAFPAWSSYLVGCFVKKASR